MGGCTSAPADQPPPLPAMPSKTASAGSGGAASKGKPARAQNGRASTSDNEWDNVKTRPKSMSQDEIDIRLVESYESTWNLGASLSQIPILGTYGELHTSIFCYFWDAVKVIVVIRSRDLSAACFCFSPRRFCCSQRI